MKNWPRSPCSVARPSRPRLWSNATPRSWWRSWKSCSAGPRPWSSAGAGRWRRCWSTFSQVTILDSSTITLPDEMQEQYRGCGGGHGAGAAALKLQTELDLRHGALSPVTIEPGRSPDGARRWQQAERPAGSLRITDLGYFCVAVFAAIAAAKAYFLSLLQFGTGVRLGAGGAAVDLLEWLRGGNGPVCRCSDLAGRRPVALSLSGLAPAGGTGQPPPPEAAPGDGARARPGAERHRQAGVVRLDDPGDQRPRGAADAAGSGRAVPRAAGRWNCSSSGGSRRTWWPC